MSDLTKAELIRLADRLKADNCRLRNELQKRNTRLCVLCRAYEWLRQWRVMA